MASMENWLECPKKNSFRNLSLTAVISTMPSKDSAWRTVADFCEAMILQKSCFVRSGESWFCSKTGLPTGSCPSSWLLLVVFYQKRGRRGREQSRCRPQIPYNALYLLPYNGNLCVVLGDWCSSGGAKIERSI